MAINHSQCKHPRTRRDREKCRQQRARGRSHNALGQDSPPARKAGLNLWSDVLGGQADPERDREVWAEEDRERGGPLILEDINDPVVRAKVQRLAREQEARLQAQMLAAGIHITQRARIKLATPPPVDKTPAKPTKEKQPALAIFRAERMSVRDAARYCDVPEVHLRNALHGVVSPRAEVREKLPAYVGRTIEELFTPDALARPARTGDGYRPAPVKPWEKAA